MADGQTTNLFVPEHTRTAIVTQAFVDKRNYKQELLVLLEEALAARARKAQPRTPQPSDL